jgi:hypothetical protein
VQKNAEHSTIEFGNQQLVLIKADYSTITYLLAEGDYGSLVSGCVLF